MSRTIWKKALATSLALLLVSGAVPWKPVTDLASRVAVTVHAAGKAEDEEAPSGQVSVTWINWDGTVLKKETLNAEDIASKEPSELFTGDNPVKAEDGENTYSFSGWEATESTDKARIFTAQFSAVPKTQSSEAPETVDIPGEEPPLNRSILDPVGETTSTFDSATGTLTLKGNLQKNNNDGIILPEGADKTNVKKIEVDNAGAIFPKVSTKMFLGFSSVTEIDLTRANTSVVTDMGRMFDGCSSLTSLNLSSFDTSNVGFMNYMFNGCSSLTSLDLSSFDTSEVNNMWSMFQGCSSLTSLDLSSFDTSNVRDMVGMFRDCSSLKTIYVGNGWSTSAAANTNLLFYNCTSLKGGAGTTFDSDHTSAAYAHVDGGTENPGYLTGVFTLTLPDSMEIATDAAAENKIGSKYIPGAVVTLGYKGTVPAGYVPIVKANDTELAAENGFYPVTLMAYTEVSVEIIPDPACFSQSGDTYTIKNADGWNVFCECLKDSSYNRFSGKTVKLDADITVSTMAGGDSQDFCGTFDGYGHTLTFNYGDSDHYASEEYIAPFRYVSNTKPTGSSEDSPAAIKNLHVKGDIYTSKKCAAGLVARHWGKLNIVNCRSSIVIHSSVSGDGTHGGFHAVPNDSLTIKGCLFDGKLLTTSGTINCGGFVGWRGADTLTITDSVYSPADIEDGEQEVGVGTDQYRSCTFARNGSAGTNCYYTRTLGTAQGKAPHTIAAGDNVTLSLAGTATEYSVSGITAYKDSNGLKVGNTIYAGNEDSVKLTLGYTGTPATGYTFNGYVVNAGTLTGTENPYNLTMPAEDVTVSAEYEQIITYSLVPAKEATYTEAGNSEYYIGSDGRYYMLTDGKYVEIEENAWIIPMLEKTDISSAVIVISGEDILLGNSFNYDGTEKTVTYAVVLGGTPLTEGTDFTFEGDTTATDVGVYIVKAKGIGAYKGEIKATWKINPAAITVTINGEPVTQTVEYNKSLTVTAPAAETGEKFSHWEVNGKTVSYSATYSFIVKESVDLIPVYVNDETAVEQQSVLNLKTSQTKYNNKNAIRFTFTHSIPEGYTVKEVGLLYATNKLAGADTTKTGYATVNLVDNKDYGVSDVESTVKNNTTGKVKKYVTSYKQLNGTVTFSYAIGANVTAYTYAVGYVTVEKDGVEQTLYTNFVATDFNSANN